jgi:hypothetical protein
VIQLICCVKPNKNSQYQFNLVVQLNSEGLKGNVDEKRLKQQEVEAKIITQENINHPK